MKHYFFHRKIGTFDADVITHLQTKVPFYTYEPTDDFYENIIKISPLASDDKDLVWNQLSKFFHLEGHVSTNIALMQPMTYLPEHSDLGTRVSVVEDVIKIHVPIITNASNVMMWKTTANTNANVVNFKTGNVYIVNNVTTHSAVNFSSQNRYYLTSRFHVDSLINKSFLERNPPTI